MPCSIAASSSSGRDAISRDFDAVVSARGDDCLAQTVYSPILKRKAWPFDGPLSFAGGRPPISRRAVGECLQKPINDSPLRNRRFAEASTGYAPMPTFHRCDPDSASGRKRSAIPNSTRRNRAVPWILTEAVAARQVFSASQP